jgi:hypothetical protein
MAETKRIAGNLLVTRHAGPQGAFRVQVTTEGGYAVLVFTEVVELRDHLDTLLEQYESRKWLGGP